jgi:hypothetical protein
MAALVFSAGILVAGLVLTETRMTTEVTTSYYRGVGWFSVIAGTLALLVLVPAPLSELGLIPTFAVVRTRTRRIVLSPIRIVPWRINSSKEPVHAVLEDRGAFPMGPTLKHEYAFVVGAFEWGFITASPFTQIEVEAMHAKFSEVGVFFTTGTGENHTVDVPFF